MPTPGKKAPRPGMSDPLRRALCQLLWSVPMLLPLVAVAGAICGWEGAGVWGWVVALAAPLVAHALRMRRIALCCILCLGTALSTQMLRHDRAEELHRLCDTGQAVRLSGTVVRELSGGWLLETGWIGARVALRGAGPWHVGDRLSVVAEPLPVEEPPVPGMYSAPEWMRQNALCANLACLHAEKTGESPGWSRLVYWAGCVRHALADQLMPPGTEGDVRRQVLCALVLGDKERSERDTIEVFRRSGCLHAFAVSGLHVGLVSAILLGLLRLCRVPPQAGRYALLAGVGLYVFATGLSVPAIRAYLMLAAVMGGIILRRRSSLFNAWCFAAALILIIEPWQLFQPGFQLSFVVYAAICLGVQYGMRDTPWFGPDSYLPVRLRNRRERLLVQAELLVRGALVVSLSAWLVSLPFGLAQFHAVSTVSYVTNMALTPLLPVVMLVGLCALALGPLPVVGSACQYLALQCAGWLVSLVSLGGQYGGSFVPAQAQEPPGSAMVVAMSYGRSFCVLGNPGLLIGDVQREGDARYRVEPALFHSGFTPSLVWAGKGEAPEAMAIYRRSWPLLQQVQPGALTRCYAGAAGEFRFYFPPPRLPQSTHAHAQPIVLWLRADGARVLYLGHAAASTLETIPPEERRADVIILGCHPNEPLLDAAELRAMSASRIILLPSVQGWSVPDYELAPARVERLSAGELPLLRL